ncbi:MAG: cell division protein CrgA [Actinomycetota bacterium]
MPRSRRRSKDEFTPPEPDGRGEGASPRWVAPTMVALLLLGLAWIVVYNVAGEYIPVIGQLGGWNLVVGMGLITGGFITATQWR